MDEKDYKQFIKDNGKCECGNGEFISLPEQPEYKPEITEDTDYICYMNQYQCSKCNKIYELPKLEKNM